MAWHGEELTTRDRDNRRVGFLDGFLAGVAFAAVVVVLAHLIAGSMTLSDLL
jgi:hypothetical protein